MALRVPDHVSWKNLESGTVLLDLRNSNYFTLNETATFLWRGIIVGKPETDLLAELVGEYGCDRGQAQTDLQESLDYLMDEELLIED